MPIKIETALKNAWDNCRDLRRDNSAVIRNGDWLNLTLFEKVIAVKHMPSGDCRFTLAGSDTVTTRSRLHNVCGIPIYRRNRVPYVSATAISPSCWFSVRRRPDSDLWDVVIDMSVAIESQQSNVPF